MKASDTVMPYERALSMSKYKEALGFCGEGSTWWVELERFLQAQAEISFKAGFKYALEGVMSDGASESVKKLGEQESDKKWRLILADAVAMARLAGIKEVVEWANKWKDVAEHGDYSNGVEAFGIDEGRVLAYKYIKDLEEQWQAKLKEWGLE